MRSSCPSVIGSKVPGYTAVRRVTDVTALSRGELAAIGRGPAEPSMRRSVAARQPERRLAQQLEVDRPGATGAPGLEQRPSGRRRVDRRRSLEVDEAAGCDDALGGDKRWREQSRIERRVEEHQVERAGRRPVQPLQRVGALDPDRRRPAAAPWSRPGSPREQDRARAARPRRRRATRLRSRAPPSQRRHRRSASRRASGRAS